MIDIACRYCKDLSAKSDQLAQAKSRAAALEAVLVALAAALAFLL